MVPYCHEQIATRTWMITDMAGNQMYLLEGSQKAALIDSGLGFVSLRGAVEQITDRPVVLINTHGHLDHIGCNWEFDTCLRHPLDQEIFLEHSSPGYRQRIEGICRELGLKLPAMEMAYLISPPNSGVFSPLKDHAIVSLGGRELTILHTPGHTPGSICVWEQSTGMLFSGDTVCDQRVMLSLPHSRPINEYINSIQYLRFVQDGIRSIWPGHRTAPLPPDYLDDYLECAQLIYGDPTLGDREESVFGAYLRFAHKQVSITYPADR